MTEFISKKIEEVVLPIRELVGAVIVSYYYSPELSIPIIRLPEYSQVLDNRTWEAVTFEIAKRSFEVLGFPTTKPSKFTPEFTVFTNQVQEVQYTVVGCGYSVPITENDSRRYFSVPKSSFHKLDSKHHMNICLLIRKGKKKRLGRKEVKKQLQGILREILIILQNSEDIKRIQGGFLRFKYYGRLTREDSPAWEGMMLNQFIETIHNVLGNEPFSSWMGWRGYFSLSAGSLTEIYESRTKIR